MSPPLQSSAVTATTERGDGTGARLARSPHALRASSDRAVTPAVEGDAHPTPGVGATGRVRHGPGCVRSRPRTRMSLIRQRRSRPPIAQALPPSSVVTSACREVTATGREGHEPRKISRYGKSFFCKSLMTIWEGEPSALRRDLPAMTGDRRCNARDRSCTVPGLRRNRGGPHRSAPVHLPHCSGT